MSEFKHHEEVERRDKKKLKKLIADLPIFMQTYFCGIDSSTTAKTQIAYAYDIRRFFNYIKENNPTLKDVAIREFPLELLDELTVSDLEEYVQYLKYGEEPDEFEIKNGENGLFRRVSSLRSVYTYFYRLQAIKSNTAELVNTPKLREKDIVRLEPDEIAELLDYVEAGQGHSKKSEEYHQKTKVRDLAIITLMLGTGIRVSECVGLDIQHVDFKNAAIKIKRKGKKEATIYFGEEAEDALLKYMEERKKIKALPGHENALFYSTRKQRISVRAIEYLVKSRASKTTPLKRITPHKLRSTYGTSLYRETGDIYLVADILGHKDINTTQKHYTAMSEENRKRAAGKVTLREPRL
jgi:site-specific recombinase XerD